jgi:N-acyl-D-amino-acid deacylase
MNKTMRYRLAIFWLLNLGLGACSGPVTYDHVIRHGLIYDGSGGDPVRGDVAINADTIVAVGDLGQAKGRTETDAQGMAVAPGFINMLSWANESLIADGRSQGDIRQGVTLEVMGEGWSPGPLSQQMKILQAKMQWPRLSGPPPCASTSWATPNAPPPRPNWSR